MGTRSASCEVLLVSSDPDLHAYFRDTLKDISLTICRDGRSFDRGLPRGNFDAVVLETKRGLPDVIEIQRAIDPGHTVILAGSRTLLRRTSWLVQALGKDRLSNDAAPFFCLEDYLHSKLTEVVRGARKSAACNLHPMLVSALERPLIALALKETNGNQIRAAELLGLNRNTLRKRIMELRIPVKRQRARQGAA